MTDKQTWINQCAQRLIGMYVPSSPNAILDKDGGEWTNKQLHLEHIMKEKQTMNNDHKAAGHTTPGTSGTIAYIPQEGDANDKEPHDVSSNPLDKQVGGNHYRNMAIQPVEFIVANNIPYREANVIKYVCRHASKNGKQDLLKARHYIDMLISEYEDA